MSLIKINIEKRRSYFVRWKRIGGIFLSPSDIFWHAFISLFPRFCGNHETRRLDCQILIHSGYSFSFFCLCASEKPGVVGEKETKLDKQNYSFLAFFPRKWQSPRKSNFVQKKVSNNYFVVDIGKAGLIGFWIESIKIVGFSTRILKAFRFPRKFWKYFRKSVSLP